MTTPLYNAIMGRHRDAIRLLIELGADISRNDLYREAYGCLPS